MKTASTPLQTELYTKDVHSVADLYTFTFASGVKRWTSADRDLTFGGNTWSCSGPGIERNGLDASAGFEVGKLRLTIHPGDQQLNGEGMVRACLDRHFDDVPVLLERAFLDSAGNVIDTLRLFEGRAYAQPTSTVIDVEVRSAVDKLRRPFPPRRLQAGCPWAVYDVNCGANPASFTDARTAASGSTAKVIKLSSSSTRAVPGSKITFTSGALAGQTRTVISVSGVDATVQLPFTQAPVVGDGFNVVRGCDKARTTCRTVFSNAAKYGGFPDTPSVALTATSATERQATRYGDALPVVYGRAKVTGKVVHQGPTVRKAYNGAGIVSLQRGWEVNEISYSVGYSPSAPVVVMICDGGIDSVESVFVNGVWVHPSHFDPAKPYSGFSGALTPPPVILDGSTVVPWPVVNGTAAEGMTFAGTAHFRCDYFILGPWGGVVPTLDFVVRGRCWDPVLAGANPADVVVDMLTDPKFGFGLTVDEVVVDVGSDGQGASSYRAYCTAMGFTVNRVIAERQEAAEFLEELMVATNSEGVWSEGKLKIIPLGDTAVGGYVPPSSSVLIDEDELGREGDEDPIQVERTPDEEVFNEWPVAVYDASTDDFGDAVFAYLDEAHQADHGTRTADETRNEWITTPAQAHKVSQFLALKSINLRAIYKFRLGPRWGQLDPLDYVTVREATTGVDTLCRIKSIEENADATLSVDAWEWPVGVATAIDLTPQSSEGQTDPVVLPPDTSAQEAALANWTTGAAGTGSPLWGQVVEIPTTGRLVTMCSAGGAQGAFTSDDGGRTWQARTTPVACGSVVWHPGINLLVAVGSGVCMTSPNGETWTQRTMVAGGWGKLTYTGTHVVAFTGNNTIAARSADGGISDPWVTVNMGALGWSWHGRSDGNGRIVAVSKGVSEAVVLYSPDHGATWNVAAGALLDNSAAGYAVMHAPGVGGSLGRWVIAGATANAIIYSDDGGETWVSATTDIGASDWVVCGAFGAGAFVVWCWASGAPGNDSVYLSTDGERWRKVETALNATPSAVTFSNGKDGTRNRFVVTGRYSSTPMVAFSDTVIT